MIYKSEAIKYDIYILHMIYISSKKILFETPYYPPVFIITVELLLMDSLERTTSVKRRH